MPSSKPIGIQNAEAHPPEEAPEKKAKAQSQPGINPLSQHFRTGGRAPQKRKGTHDGELVPGIRKHVRYLSDFSDNLIRVDISHHQNEKQTSVVEIDLKNQLISCVGKGSLYNNNKALTDFPDAIVAFKIALNSVLARNHTGMISAGVNECKRTFLRIFAWMTRRNIFQLSDLNQEMIEILVSEVALKGWAETLEQSKILDNLLNQIKSDKLIFNRIYNRHRKGGNFGIPLSTIEAITGLPLHLHSIPRSFYESLAKIEEDHRKITKTDQKKNENEFDAVRSLVHTLNALSLTTDKSIRFFPFPKASQSISQAINKAKKIKKQNSIQISQDNRPNNEEFTANNGPAPNPTINLTLAECVSIFSESLRWIYDYSPAIIKTVELAREKLIPLEGDDYATRQLWKEIYQFYSNQARLTGIPITSINSLNRGEESLRFICRLLQKACLDLIGICSARRMNEILGKGKLPYGLYLGSLVKVCEEPLLWCIDSYVSKGPQDWFKFPANKLIADAYEILAKLHCLHMPYDWKPVDEQEIIDKKRKQKIFPLGLLHPKYLNSTAVTTDFSSAGRKKFLELAGVDPSRFDDTMMPYRRMFCTLHMNRYDMPEEPALQHYLGQLSPNSTYGYFIDRTKLSVGESIREIHAPTFVDKEFLAELEVSRIEYTKLTIKKMLDGERLGGGFPAVVAKLAKKLSAEVSFAKLSNELKAQHLAKDLYDKGFRADPKPHTCCMGVVAKKSDETANCFKNGALHKEEASSMLCNGCINSCPNSNSVKNVQHDIAVSVQAAADAKLPAALRKIHAQRAQQLTNVLMDEEKTAERNFRLFEKAGEAWKATISRHLAAQAAV